MSVLSAFHYFPEGHGGDDPRRRKPTWADWTNTGLPDVETVDYYTEDNPEIWLKRAKKCGLIWKNTKDLRRLFFYNGRCTFVVYSNHVKDCMRLEIMR